MQRLAHAPHVLQPTRPSAQPCHLREAQQAVLVGAWWVAAREAAGIYERQQRMHTRR